MNATPIHRSWIRRHLAWIVALSIIGGLLLSGLMIVTAVFGWIKSSDAYQLGYARASAHPIVVAALGTPIEAGLLVSGSIKISGPSGHADLAIPIRGPHGEGTVYLRAEKSLGEWSLQRLVFENEATHMRSDLLNDAVSSQSNGP